MSLGNGPWLVRDNHRVLFVLASSKCVPSLCCFACSLHFLMLNLVFLFFAVLCCVCLLLLVAVRGHSESQGRPFELFI